MRTAKRNKENTMSDLNDWEKPKRNERYLQGAFLVASPQWSSFLTPRELSQTTEVQVPTGPGRVTIPDSSDTPGDPFVEKTMRQLVENDGLLVANSSVPGSGVTEPYGTIYHAGGEENKRFYDDVFRKNSNRKTREMAIKKVSRVTDIQTNNQMKKA